MDVGPRFSPCRTHRSLSGNGRRRCREDEKDLPSSSRRMPRFELFHEFTGGERARHQEGGQATMSVRAKSVPLYSNGSSNVFARAYAKQSPKLSPAGWRRLP